MAYLWDSRTFTWTWGFLEENQNIWHHQIKLLQGCGALRSHWPSKGPVCGHFLPPAPCHLSGPGVSDLERPGADLSCSLLQPLCPAWGLAQKVNEGVLGGSVVKNPRLMQETGAQSLVREDPTCQGATKPTCYNYCACALEPSSHTTEAHGP